MKTLLTGITPTGKLTIGNYIGAIKQIISYQDKFDGYVFVADLHALTDTKNNVEIANNVINIIKVYLACGLNPKKICIFRQSDISNHYKLFYLLLSITNVGELSRMIQFKEKSKKYVQNNKTTAIPTTLLTYPVLMAADILLYSPDIVPVGIDQKQHIELTKNILERFNKRFGFTFKSFQYTIPKIGYKILNLKNPYKKMSKSDFNDGGTIYLLEDPDEAYNKIVKAVTDSENKIIFNEQKKPGISNLISIYSVLTNKSINDIENHFNNDNYNNFKIEVAKIVKLFLIKLQKNVAAISDKDVEQILKINAEKANLKNSQIFQNAFENVFMMRK